MPSAAMSTRGRITIPASVRAALGLAMRDQVEFILTADGQYSIAAARPEIGSLKGMLKKPPSPRTIEQMHEAIAAAVRRLR